jgi:hypothetical protein
VQARARTSLSIRGAVPRVALGLLPLWLLVYLHFTVAPWFDLLASNPPALVGMPLGLVMVAAALMVMAIGVVVLARTSSARSLVVTLLGLTVPAAVVVAIAAVIVGIASILGDKVSLWLS